MCIFDYFKSFGNGASRTIRYIIDKMQLLHFYAHFSLNLKLIENQQSIIVKAIQARFILFVLIQKGKGKPQEIV